MTYRLSVCNHFRLEELTEQGFDFVKVTTGIQKNMTSDIWKAVKETLLLPTFSLFWPKQYGEVTFPTHCSGLWVTQRTKMPILEYWHNIFSSLLSGLPQENTHFKVFRLFNLKLYVNLSSLRKIPCL